MRLPNSTRWVTLSVRTKALILIALPLGALVAATTATYFFEQINQDAQAQVQRTHEIRTEIHNMVASFTSVENAVSGYAWTGRTAWLRSIPKASESAAAALDRLDELVKDPEIVKRVARLRAAVTRTVEGLQINRPEDGVGARAPEEEVLAIKKLMDGVRGDLEALLAAEDRLLALRRERQQRARQIFLAALAANALAAIMVGIFTTLIFTRGISRRLAQLERSAFRLRLGEALPAVGGSDEIAHVGQVLAETGALLQSRSEKLKLALTSARILVWELDLDRGELHYQEEDKVIESGGFGAEAPPLTLENWLARVHPDDRDSTKAWFENMMHGSGTPDIESRVVWPNGEVHWQAILGRCRPMEQGSGRRCLGVVMDITDRKRVTEQVARQAADLARSEAVISKNLRILHSILSSIGDGVAVADPEGKFILFNPAGARILGKGSVESAPEKWTEEYSLFLPDMVTPYPSLDLPLPRALRGEEVYDEVLFQKRPDKPEGVWISATAHPLKDDDGNAQGGVAVFRDVTASKELESALRAAKTHAERASQQKSQFIARLSHDLRTPLNAILGFSDLLAKETAGPLNEKQRRFVTHLGNGGRHLLQMINDILDLSKIEAGQLDLQLESFSLAGALPEVLSMIAPLAAAKNLTVESRLSADFPVLADRTRLRQILFNLLSNAVKFTPTGGHIWIAAAIEDGSVRTSVNDTGIGIPKDQQAAIFKDFHQVKGTGSPQEGTGLGLPITKRLVELQGGRVALESEPERGSCFSFTLPRGAPPATRAAEHSQPRARPQRAIPMVLIVDDDAAARELAASALPAERYVTHFANSGAEALTKVRQLVPDAIVLDVIMPAQSGWETLVALKQDPITAPIPVIVVSVVNAKGKGYELGAAAYLVKPVDSQTILATVERVLHQAKGSGMPELVRLSDALLPAMESTLVPGEGGS